MMNDKVPIKSYTRSFLAEIYGVNVRVFSVWIKKIKTKIGAIHGRYFTPKQVQILFDHFGEPDYNSEYNYHAMRKKTEIEKQKK